MQQTVLFVLLLFRLDATSFPTASKASSSYKPHQRCNFIHPSVDGKLLCKPPHPYESKLFWISSKFRHAQDTRTCLHLCKVSDQLRRQHHDNNEASKKKKNKLFIFGSGQIAKAVIRYALLSESSLTIASNNDCDLHEMNETKESIFDHVYCTTRSVEEHNHQVDVSFLHFDTTDSRRGSKYVMEVCDALEDCTDILITIPPGFQRITNEGFRLRYEDVILDNGYGDVLLSHMKGKNVGYVSTSGVYGNHENKWVDEESECCDISHIAPVYTHTRSKSDGLKRLRNHTLVVTKAEAYLDTERRWASLLPGISIFRCSGLYGSDSASALHTIIRKGMSKAPSITPRITPLERDDISSVDANASEGYTSRIHVEDAGRAIVASMIASSTNGDQNEPRKTTIINLCDDEPAQRSEVLTFAAGLLNKNGIDFQMTAWAGSSERAKRRSISKKKVSNRKLKLVVLDKYGGLKYPTYREGLRAVMDDNMNVWKKES